MTSQQIRQQFIDFFVQKHGHTFVPSAPVVPLDDPTLLFTNAGMNQFKPIFLGSETREYTRAVNTQKCIRAGGKHNDLDDVGKDTYHHTFFEMLGNWSFGDYFKAEAIAWAWELLTKVWGIDKSRLHTTVFMGDPTEGLERDVEAERLWKELTDIDPSHVHLGNKKDNFWEMGETGPCGPCSEIHIDLTPDKSGGNLVNGGDARVMEIWNLVFIQYNRGADRRLTPLPANHVDTGMGFERICAVLQGKSSNYDTDVFSPLMGRISELAGKPYGGALDNPVDIAFRVIADHVRMSTFAITDGAKPDNKGRDSVVRSVIRRAARYGFQTLGLREPFLHKVVGTVVEQMGGVFPELKRDPARVAEVIRAEEALFLSTIERGLGFFEEAAARAVKQAAEESKSGVPQKPALSGESLFELHATHGFPFDMTRQIAQERGLAVDEEGYRALWDEHIRISSQGRKSHAQVAVDLTGIPATDDAPKHTSMAAEGEVVAYVADDKAHRHGTLEQGAQAGLLLSRTPMYAEQGGQVGDKGTITTSTGTFEVTATERRGNWVLHVGKVSQGHVDVGQQARAEVDAGRRDTMRNHTSTHIMNWALRKVLGEHIEQKGSLVDPEKLRFDFSHDRAVTAEQVAEVERLVNAKIYADLPVTATVMGLAEAKKIAGVRAVFGEKYPDPVRVVAIGPDRALAATVEDSVEFCGGTHLHHTGQAGFFKVVAEESVSKGVRRLTAVTGRGAVEFVQKMDAAARHIAQSLSAPFEDAPRRIAALQEEVRQLKKKAQAPAAQGDALGAATALLGEAPTLGGGKVIVGQLGAASEEQLRTAVDSLKKRAESHAILVASADEEKVNFVAAVSDDLIAKGLKAGDWIRETAKVAGGGGGGRPQMAQAGGKDPAKLPEALMRAKAFAAEKLG